MPGDEDLPPMEELLEAHEPEFLDIELPALRSCDFTSDGCIDDDCGYCYGQGPRYNREAQLEAQVTVLQKQVEELRAALRSRHPDECDHMLLGAPGSCARCEGT